MQKFLLLALLFGTPLFAAVEVQESKNSVQLANAQVILKIDLDQRTYSISDAQTQEVILDRASMEADGRGFDRNRRTLQGWKGRKATVTTEEIADDFGKGKRVVVNLTDDPNPVVPNYQFRFSVYDGSGAVIMGFGAQNNRSLNLRVMSFSPMSGAQLFPGKTLTQEQTLNGSAGAEKAQVTSGSNRESANSLMVTALLDGKRRTVVWGGLCHKEFGKWATLQNNELDCYAKDPVGRLVEKGETYESPDTFYVDVTTADPFLSLEKYGRAMRVANNARPNVYDFPVLCGWGVGALSHLPSVNNSAKLVGELEAAQKSGLTKYTKVGIRLEPDKYQGNSEQGWWDDEHWARFGHLVAPYDTFAKWCAAIRERDGIPYTYFQVGMPSDDFALAYPDQMLGKDISRLHVSHSHHQPLVTYDYTSAAFQKHMQEVWSRLRRDGMRGIKFDYPETGWRSEGGFENPRATTAFAYREAFRLAREGLGPDAFLDERNLGETGRPCLDLTAGLVDTQRNWGDSNKFVPGMITIGGLRWYKNRTVFNYYPDSKTVHDVSPEERQSMLTMVYLTSGRIDLATSFTLFTPEIVHDFSRIYPAYREPFTARPLDAFLGSKDPEVYDLELSADWHQVAVYNTSPNEHAIDVPLSGDRVATGAIGLDPSASYYAYEFWSDTFVGQFPGTAKIERTVKPNCCAMLSVRKVQPNPQVLSTNRHLLQGWVDLADVKWNPTEKSLSGTAKVIGGESFRIVVANNGLKPVGVKSPEAKAVLEPGKEGNLSYVTLDSAASGDCKWVVRFQ